MISRRTTKLLASVIARTFLKSHKQGVNTYYNTDTEAVYDFLFENNYDAWFCNLGKQTFSYSNTRKLEEFIMQIHTGEALLSATKEWDWQSRETLGQSHLYDLSEDILNYWDIKKSSYSHPPSTLPNLVSSLELDGYNYKNGRLLVSEAEILDVVEEVGVLQALYISLALANKDTAFHHLQLSEEHYVAKKWDDSISNSRKFLECVLQEVASSHGTAKGVPLPESAYTRPVQVRDYLERERLIDKQEKETVASVYGLLSHTGGHPYMAENDQARLLRHLALTFSQFVMLRFKGQSTTSNT